MKLFLDDDIDSPHRQELFKDYDFWAQTAYEAIDKLSSGQVTHISLDHDLGDESIVGNGYTVACWIEEQAYFGKLPPIKWCCHSKNPEGVRKMTAALQNADKYWVKNNHEIDL